MLDNLPYGVGINYRPEIGDSLLKNIDYFDFIEIITDLFFLSKDIPLSLQKILTKRYCVLHGLKLSIGADEGIDLNYLKLTANIINKLSPLWFSDHLAYTKINAFDIGQLMPIRRNSYNKERVISKIKEICSSSNIPFLIENISYYFDFPDNEYSECEFIYDIIKKSGCGLLLDVNNLYINSKNHGYDPYDFLEKIDLNSIVEIHIAGGYAHDELLIDSHGHKIGKPVWELLEYLCSRITPHGIVLERDANFDIDDILESLHRAREILFTSPAYCRLTCPRKFDSKLE
ncbi:DUF692 domain-containing protein [Xenorhabdus thuongxuanensis]|uniref:DUF692 domain-containing protein n=1 Tax=Xenorhabdus thuongxuanensis TaxID=1873484 RepID=A0A1Q5TRH3_9GAMM|nr:DUF692 domain-containing protein [Xenorhabdus thuongxuanensis]OKP02826.1 hypothetical protein Xentx_03102 [Xenorhabdus thuongxuanensis]